MIFRVYLHFSTYSASKFQLDISEPSPTNLGEGLVDFNIDISPSCKISADDRNLTNAGADIAESLQK